MKRKRKVVRFQEEKRKKIFTEEKLNTIKEKLHINYIANILCDMKNIRPNIVIRSNNIKYMLTFI